jgi:hypothetical protein
LPGVVIFNGAVNNAVSEEQDDENNKDSEDHIRGLWVR